MQVLIDSYEFNQGTHVIIATAENIYIGKQIGNVYHFVKVQGDVLDEGIVKFQLDNPLEANRIEVESRGVFVYITLYQEKYSSVDATTIKIEFQFTSVKEIDFSKHVGTFSNEFTSGIKNSIFYKRASFVTSFIGDWIVSNTSDYLIRTSISKLTSEFSLMTNDLKQLPSELYRVYEASLHVIFRLISSDEFYLLSKVDFDCSAYKLLMPQFEADFSVDNNVSLGEYNRFISEDILINDRYVKLVESCTEILLSKKYVSK